MGMLKQSLEGQLAADNKDLADQKSGKAAADEEKAASKGDLAGTTKELANAQSDLAPSNTNCMTTADHEATVAARNEELAVIAKTKKILEDTSSGGVAIHLDFKENLSLPIMDSKHA